MSLNRTLAGIINASGELTSGGGLDVYATLDDLPTSGLTSGDQAYVSATSRFYISNGSGWYNVALVNATPSLSIDPTGAITLSTTGETTTITLTATDSDYPDAALTFSVDSDGSFGGLGTISQDSSVFTITPLSEDSATTTSSTLTFKASDGISFGSGTRTFTLTFKVENSNYTTLLLQNEETSDAQVDASGESHVINTGAKSTAFTPYHPGGYSTYFDGSGDYIQFADHNDLDFGSSDFTMECWIYAPSPSTTAILMGKRANSSTFGATYIALVGGNAVTSATSNNSSWDIIPTNSSFGAVSAHTWTHLAVVRNGNNFTGYLNGVGTSLGTSSAAIATNASAVTIGGDTDGFQFTGWMRDVRWVKGTAVYTSNFTPPTEPLTAISGTSLLACHLPYIVDGSTNDHALTITGNTSTKRFGPYDYLSYAKADHGGSLRFNSSTNDYMTTDGAVADADFTLGTGDFTIEYWCYWTGTNVWITVDFRTSQNQAYPALYRDGGTGALTYYVSGANKIVGSGTTGTIYANIWNHIALVRNSGTTTLYKDGKSVGSFSDSTNYASGYWKWGRNENTWYFDGWASDMRLVKGTAVYTADFTPPTSPLTAITNTKLLTSTNKNDIWDAATGAVVTKGGDVTGGANSGTLKFGKTAVYFDGVSDYIDFPSDTLYALGSRDFTIEMWVNFTVTTSDTTYRRFFMADDGGNIANNFQLLVDVGGTYGSTGAVLVWAQNGSNVNSNISSTTAINDGNWHHVAVSRTSNTVRLFVDGTRQGTNLTSWTHGLTSAVVPRLGSDATTSSGNYQGYIQDFRYTIGFSRYTTDSSFTPPTAEFSG